MVDDNHDGVDDRDGSLATPSANQYEKPHPYVIWVGGACAANGAYLTFGGVKPGSIEAALPDLFVWVWSLSLLVGGLMVLGAFTIHRDKLLSLLIERAGKVLIGGMCTVYGIATLAVFGTAAIFPGLIIASLGIASLYRVYQISHRIQLVRTMVHQIGDWRDLDSG